MKRKIQILILNKCNINILKKNSLRTEKTVTGEEFNNCFIFNLIVLLGL